MPRPRALLGGLQARRTLGQRLTGLADRIRQLHTKFGMRSTRVFLVWTRSTGPHRGEGAEEVVRRVELLPTPKVQDLSALALNPYSAGRYPVGSVRLTEVSSGKYTRDLLSGRYAPDGSVLRQPWDFFYELVEDGRGDEQPARMRFRLAAEPVRREGNLDWSVLLERAAEDMARDGQSNLGVDHPQPPLPLRDEDD
jgi:hypothetical protein